MTTASAKYELAYPWELPRDVALAATSGNKTTLYFGGWLKDCMGGIII